MVDKRPRYSEDLTFNLYDQKPNPQSKLNNSPTKQSKHQGSKHTHSNFHNHSPPTKKNKNGHHHHDPETKEEEVNQNTELNRQYHYISTTMNQSFKEYAYYDDKNIQFRETMEDYSRIVDKVNNDPQKSFFSLYDGHGGFETAKYVSEHFHNLFAKYLNEKPDSVEALLYKTFLKINEELKNVKGTDLIGSTATIIYINKETDAMVGTKKVLYCANVGDTSCVLFSKSGCKRLTSEHKCTDVEEVKRIKRMGGSIINERLSGKLAISRAFGDFSMKEKGLIVDPSINKVILSDSDKFVVLCSDGIWDVLDEKDLFYLTLNTTQSEQITKAIIKQAKEKGSTDNMSCIVIRL